MEESSSDVLYLIYERLDINSAKWFSQVNKTIRECVPKYMIMHQRNFLKCILLINEIEYNTGPTELHFCGDIMSGTCMFSKNNGTVNKDKTTYSVRTLNGKKIMYLYYSKLVIWRGNIYTWEGVTLLSPVKSNGYRDVPGNYNGETYSKLLDSDIYYNRVYKYANRILRVKDEGYDFFYFPKN